MSLRFLVLALIVVASTLAAQAAPPVPAPVPGAAAISDAMAPYKTLAEAALAAVAANDFATAKTKLTELEKAFDGGTKAFKAADKTTWKVIDKQMDVAIDAVKATPPDAAKATTEIQSFIDKLKLAK